MSDLIIVIVTDIAIYKAQMELTSLGRICLLRDLHFIGLTVILNIFIL